MNRLLVLLILATLPIAAAAQSKPDALHTTLNQSLDRLQLGNDDARWSLTASVQYLNHGKPTESGTIKFFYAAQDQRRIAYDFPGFHQIVTHTAEGHRSDGDGGETPPGLYELLHFLQVPANRSALDAAPLKAFHIKSRGVRLDCIHAAPDDQHPISSALRQQTFCTAGGSPALRYVHLSATGYSVFFEKIGDFQGGDVPLVADILFADMPIARVQFTFAPLAAGQQAQIHPSPTSQRVRNTTLNHTAMHQLTLAAIQPGFHSFVHPISLVDTSGASMLLRIQFDPTGKVTDTRVIATTDPSRAASFAASLKGKLLADPSTTSRFMNFSLITTSYQTYGDDFPPIGDNPAMIAAPPIADH
jgi:hypothetical protein